MIHFARSVTLREVSPSKPDRALHHNKSTPQLVVSGIRVVTPQCITFQEISMLEVYNISNTRDHFAGNFDTCAGSFDRLTLDPVLATGGCIKISTTFSNLIFAITIHLLKEM